jgi:hypothetical protein
MHHNFQTQIFQQKKYVNMEYWEEVNWTEVALQKAY